MRIAVASQGMTIMILWLVVRRREDSRSKELIDLYAQAGGSSPSARYWSGQAIGRPTRRPSLREGQPGKKRPASTPPRAEYCLVETNPRWPRATIQHLNQHIRSSCAVMLEMVVRKSTCPGLSDSRGHARRKRCKSRWRSMRLRRRSQARRHPCFSEGWIRRRVREEKWRPH
jgi:hypothetical protein